MRESIQICKQCDRLVEKNGIMRCGECGCMVAFKVMAAKLIKSKCPLGKF